ncbi:glycosyltransferase [Pseudoxanthomonas mexicana]|uniref:glycosyltransferase n=1 Tax=Pseudoxanthomonas mexicana TaxID=128785 RepID=UPI003CCE67DC
MEIVHVVENLDRGGLERTVVDLIASQRDAGHECRVICLFKLGLLARELLASGVRVDACGKRPGLDLRALRRARALIRQSPDAVIHTHNAMAHYYAVLASLSLPVKCRINTRHGMGGAPGAAGRNGCTGRACAAPTMRSRCARRRASALPPTVCVRGARCCRCPTASAWSASGPPTTWRASRLSPSWDCRPAAASSVPWAGCSR